LDIPDEIMIQRITSRAPISPEDLKRRLERAQEEREKAKKLCNHIVMTDLSLEENVQRVKDVLDKEINN
jgi:dephospho-CoA kinase